MTAQHKTTVVTSLSERMIRSPLFDTLYRTSMKVAAETAEYIEGSGRSESRALRGAAKMAYAHETMQLTTRLLRIGNWLLLHRSVAEGERGLDDCARRGIRVQLRGLSEGTVRSDLPSTLQQLIIRSNAVAKEVLRLDNIFHPPDTQ